MSSKQKKQEKVVAPSNPVRKLAIPEDKVEEYKQSFDYFDRNGDGSITVMELTKLLTQLGQNTSEGKLKEMIDDLDQNGDGEINFEEYITFMDKNENEIDETEVDEEEILKAFKTFDTDGDGYLNCAEFSHILKNLGDTDNRFTDEEVNQVFQEADLDMNGKLNYREFIELWKAK